MNVQLAHSPSQVRKLSEDGRTGAVVQPVTARPDRPWFRPDRPLLTRHQLPTCGDSVAVFASMESRARLRRANQLARAGSRQGPPRSGAGAPSRTPAASPATPAGTPRTALGTPPGNLTYEPPQEHPPDSGPRQRRFASLRDGLRPPLTRPSVGLLCSAIGSVAPPGRGAWGQSIDPRSDPTVG